jgi:hypothetical protein
MKLGRAVRNQVARRWSDGAPNRSQGDKEWVDTPAGAHVFEIMRGRELPDVPLQPETEELIVLQRPYRVRLLDEEGGQLVSRACTITFGSSRHKDRSDGQGWIEFAVGEACPASATVEWREAGETYRRTVALACHGDDEQAVARARLTNLGYDVDGDLEAAVSKFQLHKGIDQQDLIAGRIPSATVDAIRNVWNGRHG